MFDRALNNENNSVSVANLHLEKGKAFGRIVQATELAGDGRSWQNLANNSKEVKQLATFQCTANQGYNLVNQSDKVVQPKITIGQDVYAKKSSNATKALKNRMRDVYGGANWKRGWVKYMTEAAGKGSEIAGGPFKTELELANQLLSQFPPNLSNSPEAQFLKDAFKETNLSLVGFIWRTLKEGYKLNDGRTFTQADLVKAMSSRDGTKLIGDHWRDKNNEEHGGQIIQGKHEWILTSDLMYVINNAKNIKDLQIWFMAAEMLRSPTQNVIFDFGLDKKDVQLLVLNGVKLSDLGKVSAHPGGLYQERDSTDQKKTNDQWNVQSVKGSIQFHDRLQQLLRTHLNDQKSDIVGYLNDLVTFHQREIWSGQIGDISPDDFEGVQTGFYSGTKKWAPKKDNDLKDFMLRQHENFTRDQQILKNQAKAILAEVEYLGSSKTLAV
ncbi:MAG: hypothetical protein AAFN93_24355, partial [Bacteroidota bacterium]